LCAKKRKQKEPEKVEEEEIKLPEFDDEAFMVEETRAAKVSFIAIGWGAVAGILTFVLFWITGEMWQVSVAFGFVLVAGIIGLLMFFKIDLKELNWKNYLAGAFSYLATWLIVFIILINMPIYDRQSPDIKINQLYFEKDDGTYNETVQGAVLKVNQNHSLVVIATDNSEIQDIELIITYEDGSTLENTQFKRVTEVKAKYNFTSKEYGRYHDHIYEYNIPTGLPGGRYEYEVTANDDNDHSSKTTGNFYIG
jgi:hypothetical protein